LPGVDRYSQHAGLAPPNEALPGEDETWPAVTAIRPDTAFVRSRRFISAAGEFLTAVAIIGGGCILTGLASLLCASTRHPAAPASLHPCEPENRST
jgi:hypothetical protein